MRKLVVAGGRRRLAACSRIRTTPDAARSRRRQGDDRRRRVRRLHREPARRGDVRAGPGATPATRSSDSSTCGPGRSPRTRWSRGRSISSRSTCRRCSCSWIANAQAFERSRRCRRQDRELLAAERDLGAHAVTGAGHERVRGERGDGPAVRPDDDELARPRRRTS